MNLHWLITNSLAALILPPMGLVMLAALGWVLSRYLFYLGRGLIAVAVILLIALSTDAGASLLAAPLERQAQADLDTGKADVIVVLGGGRMRAAAGQGVSDQVGPQTLMRLRMGAQLHRQTRLPVLVSGGAPDGAGESEAVLMARSLKEDFGITARWIEEQSANTAGNAVLSAPLLHHAAVRRILLVTDAIHMPRARLAFERAGLEVVPAPTNFLATRDLDAASFIPNARALKHSHYALHEWLGLLWYQVSYGAAI